jgi:hypothetical protein
MEAAANVDRKAGNRMLSIFFDTLLPNRGWRRRLNAPENSTYRRLYWSFRIGLALVLILAAYLFNIRQHPILW